MKEEMNIMLINGSFTKSQAKEILVNVITTKIQFHQLKNFSSIERTGFPDVLAETRLPKLREDLRNLREYLDNLNEDGETITIKSEIIISK
jgi:hypothetical protein